MKENVKIVNLLRSKYGTSVTRQDVLKYCKERSISVPTWIFNDKYRVSRGEYRLPLFDENGVEKLESSVDDGIMVGHETPVQKENDMSDKSNVNPMFYDGESLVPTKNPLYTAFGNHGAIKDIIRSKMFYPTFITGLSGNGKTTTVLQVCAEENRGCLRVNITCETDEDDLLGGFRLVNGDTKFQYGPVVEAMRGGHILLLDEIDLASSKIMCLQPILEGQPVYLKKINEIIRPSPGFNIIATANTKGQGSDSGKFIGTGVLNEAFLDRYSITMEQEYPPASTEVKIINAVFASCGITDSDFAEKLVKWANSTRKLYYEDGIDDLISTRRLIHIAKGYSIFGKDRKKAVRFGLDRFSNENKKAFYDMYKAIDEKIDPDSRPKVDSVKVSASSNPFA